MFEVEPKFELGQVVQTRGIAAARLESEEFADEITRDFLRYVQGDWGDTCAEDSELNNNATKDGDRIVAKYNTTKGDVFIITEWDRSYTTILFASEY